MNEQKIITRSEFLRGGLKTFLRQAAEVVDNQVEAKVKKMVTPALRPPGAIDELAFLANCTRCEDCIEACPHNAIVKAPPKFGAAVGTPIIEPAETPCYLCEDMPCIAACPEKVLLPTENIKMGAAFIALTKCFAYNGMVNRCDYCFDRCPLKNTAISMEDHRPIVNEAACVGCGICEYFCPAPGKAIRVVPNAL